MADSPFDAFGPVSRRRQQMSRSGGAYPDPGYVPDDAPAEGYSPEQQQQDQTIDQGQAALAQQQRQQAADQVAQQKAQDAQTKQDTANWQDQAKVDAANDKADGVITRGAVIPGPDGKDINVQARTQNPDGTTAYKPEDMGIQTLPDGSAYRVNRDQWGKQTYSDPYQAGVNANVALNAAGQAMATPKGKGAADLPQKDVSTDPNALNQPQISAALDDREQKLVGGAAKQRVADTVQIASDQAASDFSDAQQAHTDAKTALAVAKANQFTDPDSFKQATDGELAARQALVAAGQKKNAMKVKADQAKADPLGYLEQEKSGTNDSPVPATQPPTTDAVSPQPDASSPGGANPSPVQPAAASATPGNASTPPSGTPTTNVDPPDPNAGKGPDPWANFKFSDDPAIAARQQAAMKAYKAMQPAVDAVMKAQDDVNDVSSIMSNPANEVDANGKPVTQPQQTPPDPVPNSNVFGDLMRRFVSGAGVGTGSLIQGVAHASRYINPASYVDDAMKWAAPDLAAKADAHQLDITGAVEGLGQSLKDKANAIGQGGLSYGSLGNMATDPARDKAISSQLISGGGQMLPVIASGGLALVTGSAQMAQQFKDMAAAKGRTPAQQEMAFGVGAVAGAAIQKLAGFVPILHEATATGKGTLQTLLAGQTGTGLLKSFIGTVAKNTVRGGAEGVAQTAAGQVAVGDNPLSSDNLKEDVAQGGQNAFISAVLGTAFHGLGMQDAQSKVTKDLATLNSNRPEGAPKVTEAQYLSALIKNEDDKQTRQVVATTAKALTNIDANTGMNPAQKAAAKASVMAKVNPAARAAVQSHIDTANDKGGQIQAIGAAAQSAIKTAGPADADLAHLNDTDLHAEQVDVADRVAAKQKSEATVGQPPTITTPDGNEVPNPNYDPNAPLQPQDFTKRIGLPQATPEYKAKVDAEVARREMVNRITSDAAQKAQGVHDRLKQSFDAANDLAKTPEGRTALSGLNDYNGQRAPGEPKADALTLKSAGDLAPESKPGAPIAAAAAHYVPVAHQIEQLTNPDQKVVATAAMKLANGRSLNSDEQAAVLGDPATGQPGAVDSTTGKPLVAQGDDGKAVLTDAGLSRLKSLVPAAADLLPGSEQAQREANAKQAETPQKQPAGKKTAKNSGKDSKADAGAEGGGGPVLPPLPHHADMPDEVLEHRIEDMQAAMDATKARGAKFPAGAEAEIARLRGERNRRANEAVPAKEGDEIQYHVPNAASDAQGTRSGQVVEVHPDGYSVTDAESDAEHRVPFSHVLPRETKTANPETKKEPPPLPAKASQPPPLPKDTRSYIKDQVENHGLTRQEAIDKRAQIQAKQGEWFDSHPVGTVVAIDFGPSAGGVTHYVKAENGDWVPLQEVRRTGAHGSRENQQGGGVPERANTNSAAIGKHPYYVEGDKVTVVGKYGGKTAETGLNTKNGPTDLDPKDFEKAGSGQQSTKSKEEAGNDIGNAVAKGKPETKKPEPETKGSKTEPDGTKPQPPPLPKAEKKGTESQIPSEDTNPTLEEHLGPDLGGLLSSAHDVWRPMFKKLGLSFHATDHGSGTFGLAYDSDPTHPNRILVDRKAFQESVDYLRSEGVSEEGIRARVQAVLGEEVDHAVEDKAAEAIAKDSKTTEQWSKMSPDQVLEAKNQVFADIFSTLTRPVRKALYGLYPALLRLSGRLGPAHSGREYTRMVRQLAREGRVSELAHVVTPQAKTLFQRVYDFVTGKPMTKSDAQEVIKKSYARGDNPLIDELADYTKKILDAPEPVETPEGEPTASDVPRGTVPKAKDHAVPKQQQLDSPTEGLPLFEEKPLAKEAVSSDVYPDEQAASAHGQPRGGASNDASDAAGVPAKAGGGVSPGEGGERPDAAEQVRPTGTGSGQAARGNEVPVESRSPAGAPTGSPAEREGAKPAESTGATRPTQPAGEPVYPGDPDWSVPEAAEQPGGAGRVRPTGSGGTGVDQRGAGEPARTLPAPDTRSRINRDAAARAELGVAEDGTFPKKSAPFVGRDGKHATISKGAKGKFRVSYFDPKSKTPWAETRAHTTLKAAIRDVTGRGYYYHGKEEADLIDRMAGMSPDTLHVFLGSERDIGEHQLHVAEASLTDQGKEEQAAEVAQEIQRREDVRAEEAWQAEQRQALHESLGPSLAEHVSSGGGLPKPGTILAGELGRTKPNVKIDQKRGAKVSTEYTRLYDNYQTLMRTPENQLNDYQRGLKARFKKSPLFTDNPRRPLDETIKGAHDFKAKGTDQRLDGTDFVEALSADLAGVPHYPEGNVPEGGRPDFPIGGAVPADAEQAARDYLDKNEELPLWLHQAVGKLFQRAVRAGGNAVSRLIDRIETGKLPPRGGVTMGGARWEGDEREKYLPTKESLPGTVDTRDMHNAAQGLSSALRYQEALKARAHPVLEKAIDIGSKIYQGVKGKAEWLDKMNSHFGNWLANLRLPGEEEQNVKSSVYDFVAHGAGTPGARARFVDDALDHVRPALRPATNPSPARDLRVKRSAIKQARVNALIDAARQSGQRRFSFTDGSGATAQIYTAHDGTSSVRLPSDAGVGGNFQNVKAAVQHLVDKGFDFQSATLERKLARDAAVNRIAAMVSSGLKLGQKRFHFAHDDGRTAALIARNDGKFSVAGLSELKQFGSARAASDFLHDRGFNLLSSGLEKDLRAKGLHPDQANEPVPYSDKQRETINQYRRAKGQPELVAGSAPHLFNDYAQPRPDEDERVPVVQASREIGKLIDGYRNGQLNHDEFHSGIEELANKMAGVTEAKRAKADAATIQRGADMVREKLLNSRRRGFIPHDQAGLALWALDKNPNLANGLGISVRKGAEGMVAGQYDPAKQVISLFKGNKNPHTAVHEILHHAERMMPEDVQEGIAKQWSKAWADAFSNSSKPEEKRALLNILWSQRDGGRAPVMTRDEWRETNPGQSDEAFKAYQEANGKPASALVNDAFKNGDLNYQQHYQLVNPSEYWAVNAARILGDRNAAEGSWPQKAKQWLSEMVDKVKGLVGLKSDAPVLGGLKSVMEGDGSFQHANMVAHAREYLDARDTSTADLFDQKPPETEPGQAPLTKDAALKIYRALSALRDKNLLKPGQASLLERAEKALGQKFIDGLETSAKPAQDKPAPPKVNFGKPDTGIKHELVRDSSDMFNQDQPGQHELFGAAAQDERTKAFRDENGQRVEIPQRDTVGEKMLGYVHDTATKHAPDLADAAKTLAGAKDELLQVIAPHLRGEQARKAGRILVADLPEIARNRDIAQEALKKTSAYFDSKTPDENLPVLYALDEGTKTGNKDVDSMLQTMREMNVVRRDRIRAMPNSAFKNFLVDYLPHIFHPDDVDAARQYFQRKIEGSTAFLKHRTIPSLRDALNWEQPDGTRLRLVSYNPADLYQIRWHQMDKHYAAQKIAADLQDSDLARPFASAKDAPFSWVPIQDKIGMVLHQDELDPDEDPKLVQQELMARNDGSSLMQVGNKLVKQRVQRLYAPAEVAQILNNYLSPGLRDKATYKIISGVANTLNQANLGLSAFHAGFTTMDAMTSKLALGLEKAHEGRFIEAGGDAAQALTGVAAITNLMRGDKLLKEWLRPGSQGDEVAKLLDVAMQGGMRVKQDERYVDGWSRAFMQHLRQGSYGRAALRMPFAAVEAASKPIMNWLVPRQKLGIYMDLARNEMRKLGPNATQDDVRKAMQAAWKSVDNRMGQVVYDNYHFNKSAKDLAMIAFRSVGWNLGTFEELGGGAVHTAKYLADAATGKKPEFSHRMAYSIALPMMAAWAGGLMTYLATGQRPDGWRDYFFPRTGGFDGNGNPTRASLPSYIKDVAGLMHQPGQTLSNKANPIWGVIHDLAENRDYASTEIVHPNDDWFQKQIERGQFIAKSFLPFGVEGMMRRINEGASLANTLAPEVGLTPAPKWVNESEAEQKADELEEDNRRAGTRTQADADKSQAKGQLGNALRATQDSAARGKLIQQAVQNKVLSPKEVPTFVKDSITLKPIQRQVKYMALDPATQVWKLATPEEKTLLRPFMLEKVSKAVADDKISPAEARSIIGDVPQTKAN